MMKNKAIKCFSECNKIYGRDKECSQIRKFLLSSDAVLHITGNPGAGKTATVRYVLSQEKFLYLNYLHENKISVKQNKEKIVVIDEFDKYFAEKKAECLRTLHFLKSNNKKLITISNNLIMGNIRFQPYSCKEIKEIVTDKMTNEIGCKIMDTKCIDFLCKKFQQSGDLRLLFKNVVTAISSTKDSSINNTIEKLTHFSRGKDTGLMSNKITMSKEDQEKVFILVEISDFINTQKKSVQSIHHEIISTVKSAFINVNDSFRQYLCECEDLSILPLSKTDFKTIIEMS